MRNEQRRDNKTSELIKKVRTSISIKENETLDKKKRSGLRYNSERTRTEIIVLDTYETRKTIVYKRLLRRFTL